ncbi:hypothetical protein Micbo1qcDRAFT_179950 [Microdochium bolleyi]|uniref:Mid2 domain-containing protein n=1 Tax=Microdochium bolleyi TaxID=196109 RepID=A0A136IN91_9PEZI|nr:hypothetical protein Micbo1qcDRAFT_179950 [Microdochium bolleyi]
MLISISITVLGLVRAALGQDSIPYDPKNHFIWPPSQGTTWVDDPKAFADNVAITYDTSVQRPFSWVSSLASVSIMMWQTGNGPQFKTKKLWTCIANNQQNGTESQWWDGDIGDINTTVQHVVFLAMYACNGTTPEFFSDYFNLTREGSAGSSSTAATALPSVTTPTLPAATAPTAAPLPPGRDDPSHNVATLAGGIGGGVGGAIIIAAAGFAFWKYSKNKRHKQQHLAAQQDLPVSEESGTSAAPMFGGFQR